MLNDLKGKDFINLRDLTRDEFRYLLDLSAEFKREKIAGVDQRRYHGKSIVAHFEWGSTRTRCSFETAANDLGLGFTYLTNSHFGKLETIKDSVRVFSAMYDAIVIRTNRTEDYVREIAANADIPVINAMSVNDHPTQMLADALTMEEEFGGPNSMKGRTLAYVGACAGSGTWYGRLAALLGMNYIACGPDDPLYQLNETDYNDVKAMFDKWAPNATFTVTSDLNDLHGADVLTTECWQYNNDNSAKDADKKTDYDYDQWLGHADELAPYRLTSELVDSVDNPDVICLHMLPSFHNADHDLGKKLLGIAKEANNEEHARLILEGLEISDECFERFASVIFREAANRQPTIKAITAAVIGF